MALASVVCAVLVVGVVLVATGSVTDSPKPDADAGEASPDTTSPSITLPGSALPGNGLPGNGSGALSPDQAVLRQLGVRQSDVGPGFVVGLLRNGDQVVGETSLDLCNATFASESRRAARRQEIVAAPDGTGVFSTEAVFYDDAGGTAQAFTELRSVAAKCPSSPVPGPDGSGSDVTTFNAPPDASWPRTPMVERLAFDFTTTRAGGTTDHSVAVYLRRGRVLIGIYFARPDPQASIAGRTTMRDIVNEFAARLAKLPPSIVTGHEAPAAVPGAI